MAITNGKPDLHEEKLDLGGGVRVELDATSVYVSTPGDTFAARPQTRQEANRQAIALKKASNRLEAIGRTLPEGR